MENYWFHQVRRLTESLVAIPSISPDLAAENRCAQQIEAFLTEDTDLSPRRWPTADGRHNVACLLRGQHPANTGRIVILMGHYDTVGVDEFRAIDPQGTGEIAFDPGRLHPILAPGLSLENPDEWLFGRGAFDMKSGLAILIAVMRRLWQERERLAGNVLFLACPDEENESAGILAALPQLLQLREREGLTYLGLLNADYTAPRGDDQSGRTIYTGTVGKLLPSFYILGDPTHVSEPFRGVDAGQIAAEVVRRLNLNTSLCDTWSGDGRLPAEVAVPPMTLKVRDLKSGYNVQTAAEAFVYVNWLTVTRSPAEALGLMVGAAREAAAAVLSYRGNEYAKFQGQESRPKAAAAQVLTFAELGQMAQERRQRQGNVPGDNSLSTWLDNLARRLNEEAAAHTPAAWSLEARLSTSMDGREMSRLLVAEVAREAGLQGPAVVVFFSPPYYPHIQPSASLLLKAVEQVAAQTAVPITIRGYYPYISDMSYARLDKSIGPQIGELVENMPLFGRGYWLDFEAMAALDCPVVNIGPWGAGAHGLYERVYMPYSFEIVPQLIYETVKLALEK